MKLRAFAAALFLAAAACSPAKKAETAQPEFSIPSLKFTERRLPNGLKVYAMPDPDTANVSVQVWYDVGSKNDPAGRSGFAHLFEHLMFKSTSNMPPEFFDRLTEDVGGYNNASTWNDFTNYYEVVPANHLQRVLWAEAERMGSLVIDDANFKSERDVVKEELRQSVLSQPYGKLFGLYAYQTAFDVHPYGRPGIGSIADLDAASISDVRAFHAAYYRPDNAVLVVSGKFDEAQLNAWVDQYFGSLKAPDRSIPRVSALEPEHAAARSFTVYEPNVPLPAIMMSWQGLKASDPELAAWMIADAILARGQSSRLYQSLVYTKKLAAEAGAQLEVNQDPGLYSSYVILSEGKSVDDALAALKAEIARMRDTTPTPAELDEAKNELLAEWLTGRETAEGRANELARSVTLFGDPAAGDKLLARLQAVSAADVQAVARRIMDDNHSITIRYLPEADQNGAKEDAIADAKTIEALKIDIPAAEIPTFKLSAESDRVAPPAPGPAVAAKTPPTVEKTLANGLRVIVAERPGLPWISATLRLPSAGSAADPDGRSGLAALTADLANRGTASRPASEIARQVESLGATLSTGAGADAASISVAGRSDKADPLFDLFSDVIEHPAFADEELDRARQETLDNLSVELRQPSSIGRYAMSRLLFGGAGYGKLASPKSIGAITRQDIVDFYTNWAPASGVLVITGAITPDMGFELAERTFGDWPAPAAKEPATATAGPAPGQAQAVLIDVPQIGQAAVLMGSKGPARGDADYFPALVANDVLGGGYSARLNAEIRIKRGLSYGARSVLPARQTSAPIIASAQTRNNAVTQVVQLMASELGRLGGEAIPAGEIDARKSVLIGRFGRDIETSAGLADQIASLAQLKVPLDRLSSYAADVAGVTADQAAAAARKYYDPASAKLVVVGDAKVFGAELKKAKPGIETIGIDALNLDSATLK